MYIDKVNNSRTIYKLSQSKEPGKRHAEMIYFQKRSITFPDWNTGYPRQN